MEVTIVVAVLGLVTALAAPRIASLLEGQASRDFREALMRMGAEARLMAIENSQTVNVRYDGESRQFVFETIDAETQEATEQKTVEVPEWIEVPNFTLDGAFAGESDWVLEFYPDGSGLDAGIEVEDGAYLYHVVIEGRDGSATRADGPLEESGEQEWQAGELEQRI